MTRAHRYVRRERARTCETLAATCIALAALPIGLVASAIGVLIGAPTMHVSVSDIEIAKCCAIVGIAFLFAALTFAIAAHINDR